MSLSPLYPNTNIASGIGSITMANDSMAGFHHRLLNKDDIDKLAAKIDMVYEQCGIITRDVPLESRWHELKELGDKYQKLRNELIERELVFNTVTK